MQCRVHIDDWDNDRSFLGQTGWVLVVLNLWYTIKMRHKQRSRTYVHLGNVERL